MEKTAVNTVQLSTDLVTVEGEDIFVWAFMDSTLQVYLVVKWPILRKALEGAGLIPAGREDGQG